MAGIPYDGTTDSDGNPVLPGVPVSGTGVEADKSTGNDTTHTSTAGSYGSLGAQVSGYSNLTEGNVRDILGSSSGTFDAWANAWSGLCDLIAQFPFVRDILAFGGNVQNGLMQFLGGIQNLADAACALLLGEQTYTASVTSVAATSTRITFTIATAANHQIPTSVVAGTSFTVSGLSNNKYNGAFKVISVTPGSTQSTVVCSSTAGVLSATAMSGTFTVRTTPTSLLAGIAGIVTNILSLFGVDKLPAILTQVQDWINCIGGAVGSALDGTVHTIANIFTAIGDLVKTVLGWFGLGDGHVFKDIIDAVQNVMNCIGGAVGAVGTQVGSVVFHTISGIQAAFSSLLNSILGFFGSNQTISGIITWVTEQIACWWTNLGAFVTAASGAAANTLKGIFGQIGNLLAAFLSPFENGTLLHNVVDLFLNIMSKLGIAINGVLVSLPSVTQVFAFFQNIIDFFWNTFSWFLGGDLNQAGKTVQELVNGAWTWISTLFGDLAQGAYSIIHQISSWITGIEMDFITNPVAAITSFFQGLAGNGATLLYNIVNAVAIQMGQTIDTLGKWAFGLLHQENIWDFLKAGINNILGVIPIGNIGDPQERVNLLSLGDFKTAASVQALNGWTWDSASNRSGGSVGGTAKLDCAAVSGTKTLYSNQNIKVSVGDQLALSSWIRTADSFNGTSNSISLKIIPFAGATQKPTVTLAYMGASTSWVNLSNENSPFTTWTVPKYTGNPSGFGNTSADQITSVQVALSVTASTGSVYFDDLALYKTGLMQQGLVDSLPSAFGGLIDGLSGSPSGTTTSATASASNMHQAATSPSGAAAVANTAASAAKTNVQTVSNAIATTVGGYSGYTGTNFDPAYTSLHFNNFFGKLYGSGQTTPQDTVPQASLRDIPQTFGGLYDAFTKTPSGTTTSFTGNYSNFHTAVTGTTGLIGVADSNATTAKNNTRDAIDAIAQTVGGNTGATNQAPSTVATNFSSFFTKLYGTGKTTPQNSIATTALPSATKYTEGSGTVHKRTDPTAWTASTEGRFAMRTFFPSNGISTTPDITITYAQGTGYLVAVKVLYDGWYLAEVCYPLNHGNTSNAVTTYQYPWSVAPAIFTGTAGPTVTSCVAVGQDSTHLTWFQDPVYGTRYGWGSRYAKSSFTIYLYANTYVSPGIDIYMGGHLNQDILKADGTGQDAYFSISLLNRSLA